MPDATVVAITVAAAVAAVAVVVAIVVAAVAAAGLRSLQGISCTFNVNIIVHQLGSPPWEIRNFPPSAPVIHLSYHDGEHYASVRCVVGGMTPNRCCPDSVVFPHPPHATPLHLLPPHLPPRFLDDDTRAPARRIDLGALKPTGAGEGSVFMTVGVRCGLSPPPPTHTLARLLSFSLQFPSFSSSRLFFSSQGALACRESCVLESMCRVDGWTGGCCAVSQIPPPPHHHRPLIPWRIVSVVYPRLVRLCLWARRAVPARRSASS